MCEAGEARVISQSLSALPASDSSDCIITSAASPDTSHAGSAELVPVRDEAPAAAAAADMEDTAESEGRFSKGAQHHGSMTFIVDFGGGAGGRDGSGGGSRDPGTPLSECLPARLRRKSVQYRMEREEQDENHDAEVFLSQLFTVPPYTNRIIRPPVRSNGRTYKMLVMFFFF